jgi:hypothetical protein
MDTRYVVLRHDGVDEPHFDLLIETTAGGPLRSWRLSSWPLVSGDQLRSAAPHRTEYLTYEGEVSGGRGTVHRVAAGTVSGLSVRERHLDAVLDGVTELTLTRDGPDTWFAWSVPHR